MSDETPGHGPDEAPDDEPDARPDEAPDDEPDARPDEAPDDEPAPESELDSSSEPASTSGPASDGEPTSESEARGGDAGDGGSGPWTPAWLADLRANDDRRHAALVAAALVGVGASMVHWLGLFLAGALVGLASKTLRRAPVAGLAVGVLVLVVHVGASPVMGPAEFLALTPAAYLSVGAALLFPLWGSLVRGVL